MPFSLLQFFFNHKNLKGEKPHNVPLKLEILLHLEDADLAPRGGQRHGETLAVDTEAVALARGGKVEAAQVGDVRVPVHHCPLDVTELGRRCYIKDNS